jgi:hypothetical protein
VIGNRHRLGAAYELGVRGEVCLELPDNGLVTIRPAPLLSVRCMHGAVWITRSEDSRDFVLVPGEAFRFETTYLAYILALRQARLVLLPNGAG